MSLARALARNGRTAEAIVEYERLIASKPEYVAARRALAELQAKIGNYDSAIQQLQEVLKTNASNPLILEQMGDVEKARGNPRSAQDAYVKALNESADDAIRKRIRKKMKS